MSLIPKLGLGIRIVVFLNATFCSISDVTTVSEEYAAIIFRVKRPAQKVETPGVHCYHN
jgi:hypothetical protein